MVMISPFAYTSPAEKTFRPGANPIGFIFDESVVSLIKRVTGMGIIPELKEIGCFKVISSDAPRFPQNPPEIVPGVQAEL
jgi:hypothetical protein